MKSILLSFKGFEDNKIFTKENENDSNGPWKVLKRKLLEIDYDFKTVDNNDLSIADKIIFLDEVSLGIPKKPKGFIGAVKHFIKKIIGRNIKTLSLYDKCINLGLKNKMVLMLWETASFDPDNYSKELFDKFDTILTWKDDLIDNKKFFKYLHPYPNKDQKIIYTDFKDKKMIVNISMNKTSTHPNELYKERRNAIDFFEKNAPLQFDLYGYGWNKPINRLEKIFPILIRKYQSYRGTCKDKYEVLAKYKFSVCYENIQKENGWITEKIFDCFRSHNVPVYWGSDNVTDFIPENTFIDRRKFKDNEELFVFLQSIDEQKYNQYLENIDKFLNSEQYKIFLPDSFAENIINLLKIK